MASILTYPECVNDHNKERLKQCVRNGPKKYPGARFVVETNGDKKWVTVLDAIQIIKFSRFIRWILVIPLSSCRDLSFSIRKRIAEDLKNGCIVHRHLVDGDVVLFNRQPSLHRMSIMCHRVTTYFQHIFFQFAFRSLKLNWLIYACL